MTTPGGTPNDAQGNADLADHRAAASPHLPHGQTRSLAEPPLADANAFLSGFRAAPSAMRAAWLERLPPDAAAMLLLLVDPAEASTGIEGLTADVRAKVLSAMASIAGQDVTASTVHGRPIGKDDDVPWRTRLEVRHAAERYGTRDVLDFDWLLGMDSVETVTILSKVSELDAAIALTFAPPKRAHQILELLQPQLAARIMVQIGRGPADISWQAVAVADQNLRAAHRDVAAGRRHRRGSRGALAAILNQFGLARAKHQLKELGKLDPDLAVQVRPLLFTFGDLELLHPQDMEQVVRSVRREDLAIALLGADESLFAKVLQGMSPRAAETFREELALRRADFERADQLSEDSRSHQIAQHLDQIQRAQNLIAAKASELDGEGRIVIEPAWRRPHPVPWGDDI